MMKPIVLSALLAGLAACAGSDGKGDTANSNKPVDEAGTACEEEIAMECEEGFVDACLLTPESATTHSCVEGALPGPEVPEGGEPGEYDSEEGPTEETPGEETPTEG
jgi:hypothetical protein